MTDSEYRELTAADLAERWRPKTALESLTATASQPVGEEYADPETALRWLRSLAWGELQEARRQALNGAWSMQCDNLVDQIVGLTSLVGPEPWESVQVDLILDGMYERLHEAMGCPTPLSDDDRRRAQEVLDRRAR
jgi:hypothetical protein